MTELTLSLIALGLSVAGLVVSISAWHEASWALWMAEHADTVRHMRSWARDMYECGFEAGAEHEKEA